MPRTTNDTDAASTGNNRHAVDPRAHEITATQLRAAEIAARYNPDNPLTADDRAALRQASAELARQQAERSARKAAGAATEGLPAPRDPADRPAEDWPANSIPPQPPHDQLLSVVHRLVNKTVPSCDHLPPVGSIEWWDADDATRTASILVCGEAYVFAAHAAAAARKQASAAVSEEMNRQRELIRRRKDAIGHALHCDGKCGKRCGGTARAYELTRHHASDDWAQPCPAGPGKGGSA